VGLDFIRSNKGKAWQRGWTAGLEQLTQPTLFDLQFTEDVRVLVVDRIPGASCKAGAPIILALQPDDSVIASDAHCEIGRVAALPTEVLKAIKSASGVAIADIARVGALGDTFDVCLR
jgi:hypothetical protein